MIANESADSAAPFPLSDHLPLGRAYGRTDVVVEPASAFRPFGLSFLVRQQSVVTVDPDDLGYADATQLGTVRVGAVVVPLSKHTTGQTNTVTQGGDGQHHNNDSDTDARED